MSCILPFHDDDDCGYADINHRVKLQKEQEKRYLISISVGCLKCDGKGEVRECDAAGSMDWTTCSKCNGSGIIKKQLSIMVAKDCAREVIRVIEKYEKDGYKPINKCEKCNNSGIDIENDYDSQKLGFTSYCDCEIGKRREEKELIKKEKQYDNSSCC